MQRTRTGFTILELLIVATLIALAAALALPDPRSRDLDAVTSTANTLAEALRFARDSAIRSGQRHQVSISTDAEIVVSMLDDNQPPTLVEDARHPLTRQPYRFTPATDPGRSNSAYEAFFMVDVSGTPTRSTRIAFDDRGIPKLFDRAAQSVLLSGYIDVGRGQARLRITLDPGTGRVAVVPV